ncbi:O-antigen ligase family protein [Pseudomonas lundensis]|nr:O-antigen ligase family protein [Pseudomonas lundensis]
MPIKENVSGEYVTIPRVPNYYIFFTLGMMFLSFSSSPDSGGVITFGVPFFLMSIFLFVPVFTKAINNFSYNFLLWPTLFVALIFTTSLLAVAPLASMVRAAANLIGYMLFLGLVAASIRRKIPAVLIARTLLSAGAVLAIYFIINFVYKSYLFGFQSVILERYVGGAMSLPWGASNTVAQVLLLSVGAYLVIEKKNKRDILFLFLICAAILLTFSRSVSFLLICMLYIIVGFRYFLSLSIVAAVIFLSHSMVTSSGIEGYDTFLSSRLSVENMQSGNGRLDSALEKLNYFIDHPFEPIGYYSSIYKFALSAHNYWVTTLVEQSILGVLISVFLFCAVGRMAYLSSRKVFYGYLIVMMGLMVEDPNFVQPYIISFWVYLAMLVSRGLEQKALRVK